MTAALDRLANREEPQQLTAGQYIQQLRPEIQRALPRGMDADRVARLALTVLRTDALACEKMSKPQQALVNCRPESFAGALLTASALGLEPGVNGEAYLVAYKGECTLIVGYQGFAKLFWQSPYARHLDAQAVYANDEFDYAYGLDPYLTHKPAKGDRGDVIAYYAVAGLTTGAKVFVVLSAIEVRKLRGGKTGSNGGIPDPMHWMERKTAIRQLFKLIPKSTTLARAIDADEKTGTELMAEQVPAAALPAQPEPQPEVDENGVITAELVDEEPPG